MCFAGTFQTLFEKYHGQIQILDFKQSRTEDTHKRHTRKNNKHTYETLFPIKAHKKHLTSNNIFILSKINNAYPFMKKAKALILPSLWEEVGFVIVEAAFSNLFVISSDCPNGPKEFLENGNAGYLFKSNAPSELKNKIKNFVNEEKDLKRFKLKAKKNSSNYTLFRHHLSLKKILSYED